MGVTRTEHRAVLFADMADSTSLYRRLGDDQALRVVSACITVLDTVQKRHGGRLVKTLGDAVMCLFGSADDALSAAVDMQRSVADIRPDGLYLQIRIGLHCGPVVISGADAYGDTVNVAAYLSDAATPDQILIAQTTAAAVGTQWRDAIRPLFDAVLKASSARTAISEVLWRDDAMERTQINLDITRTIPQDIGGLLLDYGGETMRIDHWHPVLTIGREPGCGLAIDRRVVSRRHATLRVERTQFYLEDHSVNGTFVKRDGCTEMHLVRREILLGDSGEIRPGYNDGPAIQFRRDRRSIYRV